MFNLDSIHLYHIFLYKKCRTSYDQEQKGDRKGLHPLLCLQEKGDRKGPHPSTSSSPASTMTTKGLLRLVLI